MKRKGKQISWICTQNVKRKEKNCSERNNFTSCGLSQANGGVLSGLPVIDAAQSLSALKLDTCRSAWSQNIITITITCSFRRDILQYNAELPNHAAGADVELMSETEEKLEAWRGVYSLPRWRCRNQWSLSQSKTWQTFGHWIWNHYILIIFCGAQEHCVPLQSVASASGYSPVFLLFLYFGHRSYIELSNLSLWLLMNGYLEAMLADEGRQMYYYRTSLPFRVSL